MKIIIFPVIFLSIAMAEFSANVLVSANSGNHNGMPDVAVDGNGTIHVVWVNNENNHANLYYANSVDHGSTFSTPVQLNNVHNFVIDILYSGPKIAAVDHTVHVIWADYRNGYDATNIYYKRSLDNGNTWSDDTPIGDNSSFNIYCEVVAADNGDVHVIYHRYNRRTLEYDRTYHIASADSGQTFGSNETINNYSDGIPCDCCPPDMIILNDGRKMAGFRNNDNNIRDMFAVYSDPGTAEWGNLTRLSIDNFMINYCPSSGPGMSRLDDHVAVAYMTAINNTSKVFLKISHDNAATFGDSIITDISAAADISQNHPVTAITAGNWVHMVWEDERGGADIYYGGMNASNSEITNIQPLNDDGMDVPQIAPRLADDGHFVYVVWEDYRDGQQVYFTTNYDENAEIAGAVIPAEFSVNKIYPNPFNNRINFELDIEAKSDVRLNIFDLNGQWVDGFDFHSVQSGNYNIPWKDHQASGVYFFQFLHQQKVSTYKAVYLK